MRVSDRCLDLCTLVDQLTKDELLPIAHGLSAAAQSGTVVSPDMLKAVGLSLYARGIRPKQISDAFVSAMYGTIARSRS